MTLLPPYVCIVVFDTTTPHFLNYYAVLPVLCLMRTGWFTGNNITDYGNAVFQTMSDIPS